MTGQPDGYTCTHCGNIIKREVNFLKHRCKDMIRHEELRSICGRNAYVLYGYWLSKKRRGNHTLTTFGKSKLFTAFFRFTKWVSKVNLPDKQLYIRFTIMKDYPPSMWTDNAVYVQFLDWIDMKWGAEDHFRYTYRTLQRIAEAAECPIGEALNQLHPNQILVYVKARKLSPWVLLRIKSFRDILAGLSKEQQLHFQQTIRPIHWKKMINDPTKVDDNYLIKEAVKRAKL